MQLQCTCLIVCYYRYEKPDLDLITIFLQILVLHNHVVKYLLQATGSISHSSLWRAVSFLLGTPVLSAGVIDAMEFVS